MLLVPLGVMTFLIFKIWDIVAHIGFFDHPLLNFSANLTFMFITMYAIGLIVERERVRSCATTLLGDVPLLSWLVRFAFQAETVTPETERNNKAEAYVLFPDGIALQVIVVSEKKIGERTYLQCYLASNPVPATGFSFAVEKIDEEKRDDRPGAVRIYYTGRTAAEYFLTVMSYGMK